MNNKEILKNAPEGATHYKDKPSKSDTVFYYKVDDFSWHFWARDKWFVLHEVTTFTRSLADIKQIAELEKERDEFVRVGYTNLHQVHYMQKNEFSQDAFQSDDDAGLVFQNEAEGDIFVFISKGDWNNYQECVKSQAKALRGE